MSQLALQLSTVLRSPVLAEWGAYVFGLHPMMRCLPCRMPAGLLEELLLFTFVLPAADLSLPSHGESQPLPRTAIVGEALSSLPRPEYFPGSHRGCSSDLLCEGWHKQRHLTTSF